MDKVDQARAGDRMGAPTNIAAPTRIEEITAEWLTAALCSRHPGARVETVAVGPPAWGTATKLRLQIGYAPGASAGLPETMILKGGFADHREAMAWIYRHETRYYREIQRWLEVPSPTCFATIDDDGNDQHIVLMEDLTVAQARFCRVQDPLTREQAMRFLDVLARFHGRTWNSPEFAPGGSLADLHLWEPIPADHRGDYARGQLVPDVWASYMALPRAQAVSRLFHDRDRMAAAIELLNAFSHEAQPLCLLHSDFHLGNLYFAADGSPGVLDWQSWAKGHWSHDVTYFLCSALDQADRGRWEEGLLAFYRQRLGDHGVADLPTMDAMMAAFRIQIIDGLFFWLCNPPDWQAEVNNCAVAARFAAAALDHRTFDLV